ncbi:uncharacterized protein LACBIDRAFT_310541 [Laccaria bicolor S238N-H82]|uniref:Predicted protein n=1 Tax=Laccaria bicolor (strain S238N-H82 / ATCC MYA-4686) TaxID=486041 RepID=B0DUJ9_LACBS|nr:uncharacterized protein LACBIDRAFT_310541 [Laccaria bicolor S238N-H82]EDR01755.1 predicted protein [Laccaria bicolor S238N-H82]|eukprot:XP_001887568.1 predicted protein [Laccaria bicolor S238N-H82]
MGTRFLLLCLLSCTPLLLTTHSSVVFSFFLFVSSMPPKIVLTAFRLLSRAPL